MNEEGKSALSRGDYPAALVKFQAAAKLDPGNSRIQFNLGLASIRNGQPAQALGPLHKAAADPSLAAEAHYLVGAAYFESGEFSKVAAELQGLESSTHAEHVLFMLEESYRLTHRATEAREAFHALNSRFPDSPWVHYLMGSAYENQADHQKAIAEYQEALKRDPAIPNANFAIGYLYWQDQNPEESGKWLRKEITLQPCHTLACYYLGEMARTAGDLDGAARLYRRAIQCDHRNLKAHVGLGIALSALGRDQEAVQEFRRAIELAPSDATPHYRLAVLYAKLGRKAEADAEYARVKEIHAAGQAEAAGALKVKP